MAGKPVTAWINGLLCGRGQTLQAGQAIVYSVNVFADGPGGSTGCGARGRFVTFQINGQAVSAAHEWDNSRLWEVPLGVSYKVYLPMTRKDQ